MQTLSIDIETYSSVNLPKCGVYKYAESPDFEILLFGYSADGSEVYSGVYGRASITFYAFNSSGNKGIACGLNNLQKIRDGEPLGGKASAESDFATDDDEDFLN